MKRKLFETAFAVDEVDQHSSLVLFQIAYDYVSAFKAELLSLGSQL